MIRWRGWYFYAQQFFDLLSNVSKKYCSPPEVYLPMERSEKITINSDNKPLKTILRSVRSFVPFLVWNPHYAASLTRTWLFFIFNCDCMEDLGLRSVRPIQLMSHLVRSFSRGWYLTSKTSDFAFGCNAV